MFVLVWSQVQHESGSINHVMIAIWFIGLLLISAIPVDTGGRGGITQGASFEFFESFLLIYSHNTHWVNFEFFQKLLTTLIKTYSLGNF